MAAGPGPGRALGGRAAHAALKGAGANVDATAVHTFAQLSGLLQLVVCVAVGGRLLLLARRTRRLPELAIGISFYSQALLGHPLLLLSGLGGPRVDGVSLTLVAAGNAFLVLGTAMMNLFTWQVFRRGSPPALALGVGCTLAVALQGMGAFAALASAPAGARPAEVVHDFASLLLLGSLSTLAWASFESLAYHRRLQRRLALGLADPVVANRFLLWGLYGLMALAIVLAHAAVHLAGADSLASPVAEVARGIGGLGCSAAVSLAFWPPARYERWIRARA